MRKCLVALTLLFSCINTSFALDGLGTAASPWLIQSLADFDEFTASSTYWSGHTRLDTNINLTSKTYNKAPIAPYNSTHFTGTFDGNSHTISNLTISGGASFLGLFGFIENGSVTNLGMENVNISGNGDYIGGLCGYHSGSITNCYSTGSVLGNNGIGGLCGINVDSIINCYSTGTVDSTGDEVGGFCGYNGGSIASCYSTGTVTGTESVGGLCGLNSGNITNCYFTGSVSGDNDYVGGICGTNGGSITSCYTTGTVDSTGDYVGGLCGINAGSIASCYSTGTVNATGDYIGGFCGHDYGHGISRCYFLNTAGLNNGFGIPLTDTQLKQQSSFTGWDFIAEATNGTGDFWMITAGQYPSLSYFTPAFTPYSFSGSGTLADPYHVATIYDLSAIWQYPSADYILDNSISAGGTTFNTAVIPSFAGTFNGNNHAISNLTINGSGHLGLFGYINNGSVTNLSLENVYISATGDYVGGLCGYNYGNITNCYSTGTVNGRLAGYGIGYAGGLCGCSCGNITNCYSTCYVVGNCLIGGLCGCNEGGDITNCYSSGTVLGSTYVGVLCGNNWYGCITSCYSAGTVNGYYDTGGLCGYNQHGNVTNCYSTGIVTGSYNTGGLCGYNDYGSINSCYSIGRVTGTGSYVGGLCGLNNAGTFTNSFWDTQTSGRTTSAGGTGKTTIQMQDINTFLAAGWNFVDIWKMPDMGGYPLLTWQDDIDRYDGGLGTQQAPYQIHTTQQLLNLANCPINYNKYFILTADIDLSGRTFNTALIAPDIDNSTSGFQGTAFTGNFNGDGHKIANLRITDSSGADYLGLFGQIDSGGELTNLTVEDFSVTGGTGATKLGALTGQLAGSAENCSVIDSVITGGSNAQLLGSLIGYAHIGSVINNCYATGSVTAGANVIYLGGLIGANNGHIDNCYAMTTVSGGTNCDYLGGLTGYNAPAAPGHIDNCYSTGTVTAAADSDYLGGLVGDNNAGTVTDSFWDTDTSGMTISDGGTGKTTIQMQDINTFLAANWDFVNTWKMPDMDGYPLLSWQEDPSPYDGGLGTQVSPYQIHTTKQLLNLANRTEDYGKYFILTANIDLSGQTFATALIAPDNDPAVQYLQGTPFTGSFDGDGHKITGLTIDAAATNHSFLGLFGQLNSPGDIANLGIENVSIIAGDNAQLLGALVGYAHIGSVISNCYSTGSITAGANAMYLGGLTGANNGHIDNCYARTTVSGGTNCDYVGGLVGRNAPAAPGHIDNCYSTGAVSAGAGSSDVGGLSGNNAGSVTDSFWDTDTSGQTTSSGGEGKTTAQMYDINTFLAANWDFENIWHMPYQSTGYPMLFWQRDIPGDFTAGYGVTLIDFAIFSQSWLTSSGQPGYNEDCDLVDDDTINLADLAIFAENFLQGL